jgi:hypothetical protein
MGEMYEYFEDFPEENPGNYVGERFDPRGAALRRAQKDKVAQETATLEQTIAQMIAEGKARGEARKRAENEMANKGSE